MPKGKPWTNEEEVILKQLATSGEDYKSIANKMSKTYDAIFHKCKRLGLVEDGLKRYSPSSCTQSSVPLPPELPSSEEALKMLAGALQAATQPGLDKVDVLRLQVVSTLARAYDHLLANYTRYRQIETKLLELEFKYEQLAERTKNNAPTPTNSTPTQPTGQ
jgi:hypothetical protein